MSDAILITSDNVKDFFNLTLRHSDGLYIITGESLNLSRADRLKQDGRTFGTCLIDGDYWDRDCSSGEYSWEELHQYTTCDLRLIQNVDGKAVEHVLEIGIATPNTGVAINYIGFHEYIRCDFSLIFIDTDLNIKLFDKSSIIDTLEGGDENESN